jgi:serine/threonine-protein kinase
MQDSPSPSSNIRFGKFEVDFRQGELRRSGLRQQLGPQPFELLRALLERPGQLITRDELRQRLWPGNTFVDYELGLKKCVNRVREVLGDSADHPRYIETIPRRGYRFIATFERMDGAGAFNGTPRTRDAAAFEAQDGRSADVRAEVDAMPAQSADGALLDLPAADRLGESSVTRLRNVGKKQPAVSVGSLQRTPIVWPAIAVALLLSTAMLLVREWRSRAESASATPIRATLELTPAEHLTSAGFGRPHHTAMAFSPDGKMLVFAGTAGTTRQLYKRPLDQAEAEPIPGTEGGDGPFFSPDGQWLGFYADNSLKKISTGGGPAVPICKLEGNLWGATWGGDGSIVFAEGDLKQVSAQGGEPKVLLKINDSDSSYASPEFLPDGRTLLFTNAHGWNWDLAEILVLPNGGSPRILLKGGASPVYASAGYLIYMRSGALLAAPFDARHLEVTGPGVPLLDGVMQAVGTPSGDYESGTGQFAVSSLGTLVYASGGIYPPYTGSMVRLDRSGAAVDLHFKDVAYGLRLSPDGRQLVATKRATESRAVNVELYDLERGTATPLTSDGGSGWPIWSFDGQRVLFAERSGIDSVAADGRGAREIVFKKEGDAVTPASWSHDGRWLATLVEYDNTPRTQILVHPMTEKGEPRVFLESGSDTSARFRIFDPEFSPDSKWIAYTSTETGAREVYVQAFPATGEKHRISTNGGMNPAWAPSGRELFYLEQAIPGDLRRGSKMMAVDIDDSASFRAGAPHELFTVKDGSPRWPLETIPVRSYDVYPDGRHFIASLLEHQTDPQVARLNVVLNWFDELKRRVPTR